MVITARKLSLLAYFRDLGDDHIILHTLVFIAAILQSGISIAMKMETPQQRNPTGSILGEWGEGWKGQHTPLSLHN